MNDSSVLTASIMILAVAASAGIALILYWKKHPRAGLFPPDASNPAPQSPPVNPTASEKAETTPASTPQAAPDPEGERRRLAGAMVSLGILLEFLSLYLRADLPLANYWAYLPFLALGSLFLLGGIYLASRLDHRVFFEYALEGMALKLDIRPAQCVCLFAGILLAALATVAAGTGGRMISPIVAIVSWIAGIALTILGGWRFAPPAERTRLPPSAFLWTAALTLFGFLARAVLIGRIPVVLAGDEGSTGLDALQWLNGTVNNPFGIFGWHPYPSLYFFLESLGIKIFGRTIEAVRYPSALAGALTVGAVYLLVRAMYSHRHGLAAAAILSALNLHIHFSRLALMNIWDGLWYLITLGALWYGWQSGKRSYWILAGLAMGIGQYFYATTRTLFVTVPLWLVIATVIDRPGWRRNLKNLVPGLASLTAVLLPLAWFAYSHPNQYLGDTTATSIFGPWMQDAMRNQGLPAWRILLQQLGLGFGAFFTVNLSYWYHPGVPILRAFPAAFFLFGLGFLCLRLRETKTWIPLLWLLAFGMIASLSASTPAAQRLPGVVPACALVIGLGIVEFCAILARLFSTRKWIVAVAATLLVGCMAADDLRFYFLEYTPNSEFMGRFDFVGAGGEIPADIIRLLKDQPGRWEIVFFPNKLMGYYSNPALRFLLPNAGGIDINHPWGAPDNPAIPAGNVFFVFMPGNETEIPKVQADYPGDSPTVIYAPDGKVLFTYYQYRTGS